jgi:hypothetical protein
LDGSLKAAYQMSNITDLRILMNLLENRMDDIVTIVSMEKEVAFTDDELKEVNRRMKKIIQMYTKWRENYDKSNQ